MPQPHEYPDIIHRLDRILARNGFLPSRASEHVLMNPSSEPKRIGDHARFMLGEAKQLYLSGDFSRMVRWVHFVYGILWSLGLRSLAEVQAINENIDTLEEMY